MKNFKKTIWDYYRAHGRDLPWRHDITPYRVIVSEIMLQQTQTSRVTPRFASFVKKFPNFETLARAPLREVLAEWQGLGYNRRALQLKKLAEIMAHAKTSSFRTKESLMELPGIGPNTAGAILAFAYNIPNAFIETNIRSVFIHFFFDKVRRKIDDKEILKLVELSLLEKPSSEKSSKKTATKKIKNPRQWYYALMDYGVYVKSTCPNPSRKSRHHVCQSPFKGSNREMRAQILRHIIEKPRTAHMIRDMFGKIGQLKKISKNLADLQKEGFIIEHRGIYRVS